MQSQDVFILSVNPVLLTGVAILPDQLGLKTSLLVMAGRRWLIICLTVGSFSLGAGPLISGACLGWLP